MDMTMLSGYLCL